MMRYQENDVPKISEEQALEIAKPLIGEDNIRWIKVYPELPDTARIENPSYLKKCWAVMFREEPENELKSSRLMCITKDTGRVLYYGMANDGPKDLRP